MKNRSPLQSGVALVIVLGFLVLISILVVAFFSSVTTELKASRNYASGVTTRQLSESATQVVMGQIRAATMRTRAAWASQPGMIRTYRNNATNAGSKADAFFKLYSSDKMVVSGANDLQTLITSPDFATDWNMKPALWTDLNAPVMVDSNGVQVPRFPIIDPRAYVKATTDRNKTLKVSPNADPSEVNTEGFWYGSDNSFPSVPSGLIGPGGKADDQRLPMPVRWIYVLQDGTLTSPGDTGSSSTGIVAKWTAGTNENFQIPTKENPIVGRIAFWADDDSSKVNINTAGGFVDAELDPNLTSLQYDNTTYAGSFWDTPRFYTQFDRGMPYKESLGSSGSNKAGTPYPGGGGLAICQLLQNEFQRYPGHPSTTSLGLILGPYMKTPVGANAVYTRADQMYSILPRLGIASNNGVAAGQQAGSTKGGIFRIIPSNPTTQNNPVAQDLQIMPKGDRLYASLDELYFAAKSTDPANSPNYKRITNDRFLQSSANPLPSSAQALSPENLEKLRFFLTAQSRSPELNLFGFPRVTIWPVRFETATEASGLNPFDNVILFCSTIGVDPTQAASGRPNTMKAPTQSQSPLQVGLSPNPAGSNAGPPYRYIFTRRELPPGTGVILPTPAASWGGSATWLPDINQPRNKQLMIYLQRLTSQAIPGFGGSFVSPSKYSAEDRDQILTEIFDYIRCANLQDTTTRTIGQTTAIQFSSKGVVLPSKPSYLAASRTYTGFGRFPTLSEVSIVFYYAGPQMWPGATRNTSDVATNTGPQLAGGVQVDLDGYPYARYMRAFMLFSFFNPMQGYAPTKDPAVAEPKMLIDVGMKPDGTVSANRLENFTATYLNNQGTAVTTNLGFPGGRLTTRVYRASGGAWGGRNFGGFEGFMHTLVGNDGTSPILPHKIMEPTGGNFGTAGNVLNPAAQLWTSNGSALNATKYNDATGAQEAYPFQTMSPGILIPYSMDPSPPYTAPGTQPMPISVFDFNGGKLDVVIRYGGDLNVPAQLGQVVQAATIDFPPAQRLPIPKGDVGRDWDTTYTNPAWPGVLGRQVSLVGVNTTGAPYTGSGTLRPFSKPVRNSSTGVSNDLRDPRTWNELTPSTALVNSFNFVNHMKRSYWENLGGFYPYSLHGGGTVPTEYQPYNNKTDAAFTSPANVYPADQYMSWSFARRLAWSQQASNAPWRNAGNTSTLNSFPDRWRNIVQPGDTIRSMIYWNSVGSTLPATSGKAIKGGDLRLALIPDPVTGKIPDGEFAPHPDYDTEGISDSVKAGNPSSPGAPARAKVSRATSLRLAEGTIYFNQGSSPSNVAFALKSGANDEDLIGTFEPSFGNHVALNSTNKFPATRAQANLPSSGNNGAKGYVNGVQRYSGDAGDFDTGIGNMPDGPYLNKPDEGNIIFAYLDPASQEWKYPVPYFGTWAYEQPGNTFTSPFRQMPSPGMFGSLPSRAASRRGWETLSFSPVPAGDMHPGNTVEPKDHLLLDLFNMPVVEPYPISEPFSSAGKVNLNYKIMPFGYIGRSTAMRAALHPTRVTAVGSAAWYGKYKTGEANDGQASGRDQYDVEKKQNQPLQANFRYILDRDQTIQGFDDFFAEGLADPDKGFFKSASQICERYLYPYGSNLSGDNAVKSWWKSQDLGGDNTREKPYTDLYPRVTTKSNTYTVHMRVQTLRQIPRTTASNYAQWEEGRDTVLGEYRGAATIERYIDPADPRFDPTNVGLFVNPDDVLSGNNLESVYRFRTVITKKFAPY